MRASVNDKTFSLFEKNRAGWLYSLLLISALAGPGISYSYLYLFHPVWVLSLAALFNNQTLIRETWRNKPTRLHYLFFAGTLAWFAVEIIWAANKTYALKHLFYIMAGWSLSFILILKNNKEDQLKLTLRILFIMISVEMAVSVLEMTGIFRWPVSKLSDTVSFFGRKNELQYIVTSKEIGEYIKTVPTGFHWNSNNLCTFLSLVFPFFLLHKKIWISILWSLLIVTIIVAASARANYLAVTVITISSVFFASKSNYITILAVLIAVAAYSTNGFTFRNGEFSKVNEIQSFSRRILGLPPLLGKAKTEEPDNSGNIRAELIRNGLEALRKNYGIGLGGGNSKVPQEAKGGVGVYKITSMHNFWIETLVEGGVLYALAYGIWYCSILWGLFLVFRKSKKENFRYYASACLLAGGGFIIAAMAPSSVIYFFPMYLFWGICIAIIQIWKRENADTHSIRY